MTFAAFLNENLARLDLTPKDLARVCGVPTITVQHWRDGVETPHYLLQNVAKAYLSQPQMGEPGYGAGV